MYRLKLALFVALATLAGASPRAAATDPRWIHLRGPGDPDCAGEAERARARGEAAVYLAQVKCRVQTRWKCPATCKGDELLVTHVAVRLQRNGLPDEGKVIRASDSPDFDDMSVKAVRTGAPYPAPPAPLLDGSGAAALNIEFACDCAERPKTPK